MIAKLQICANYEKVPCRLNDWSPLTMNDMHDGEVQIKSICFNVNQTNVYNIEIKMYTIGKPKRDNGLAGNVSFKLCARYRS